jgi:hypothetical protein
MAYEGEKLSDEPAATIEDELREWPESVYHLVSEAEARKRASNQAVTQKAEKRRGVVLAILALLLVTGIIFLTFWLRASRNAAIGPQTATTIQPRTDIQNTQLNVSPTENGEYYKKTEASLTSEGHEILRVVQYDFYAGKFIVDNTQLQNESALVDMFAGMREQLKDSWLIIFATASLEGYEDYNYDLCRRRLHAVKDLMERDAGISARGYWGILAGEYKMDLHDVPPEKWEDEENIIAKKKGKVWLADQRRLILITIRETAPLSDQAREQVPFVVARQVYEQGMLPRNYDAPNSPPFALTAKAGDAESPIKDRNPVR